MSEADRELQENLLAWAIRDDQVLERANRQAGRESYESIARRERFLNDWLRTLMLRTARGAAGVLLALVLAGAGVLPQPAPGPVPSQAQACTESTAAFVRRANVERTEISNGAQIQVPIGYAVAWSCASAADADAELQRRIAEILQ